MCVVFLLARRLRGLSDGVLATNDGGEGGHSGIDGYGDGQGTCYGLGDGGGHSTEGRDSPRFSRIYGDSDTYGDGCGDGNGPNGLI